MMFNKNIKKGFNDDVNAGKSKTARPKLRKGIISAVIVALAVTVAGIGIGSYSRGADSSGTRQSTSNIAVIPEPQLSEENRQVAMQAIKAVDEYLEGSLLPVQAVERLKDAYESVQPAQNSRSSDITKELNDNIKYLKNELEKEEFLNYVFNGTGGADVTKVKKYRNRIAEIANINI